MSWHLNWKQWRSTLAEFHWALLSAASEFTCSHILMQVFYSHCCKTIKHSSLAVFISSHFAFWLILFIFCKYLGAFFCTFYCSVSCLLSDLPTVALIKFDLNLSDVIFCQFPTGNVKISPTPRWWMRKHPCLPHLCPPQKHNCQKVNKCLYYRLWPILLFLQFRNDKLCEDQAATSTTRNCFFL